MAFRRLTPPTLSWATTVRLVTQHRLSQLGKKTAWLAILLCNTISRRTSLDTIISSGTRVRIAIGNTMVLKLSPDLIRRLALAVILIWKGLATLAFYYPPPISRVITLTSRYLRFACKRTKAGNLFALICRTKA